jgi:uncharacterized protein (DUF2235 family)
MALYAFDGTGQRDDKPELEDANDTNVARFFFAYRPNDADLPIDDRHNHYQRGIGSAGLLRKALGTITGFGGRTFVRRAIDKLKDNIESGDTTIDVIGFSRGAALAVSFANEIQQKVPDASIRFVGVFDVVAQFGLPGRHINAGHVVSLPANVKCCRHAMALDESRGLFPLTRLCGKDGAHDDRLVEVWFRGVHSDVGGGNGNRGLNWVALHWMLTQAKKAGLPIAQEAIDKNLADRGLPQQIGDHKLDLEHRRTFFANDCLHSSVMLVDGAPGRPHNNPKIALKRMDDEGNFVTVATV